MGKPSFEQPNEEKGESSILEINESDPKLAFILAEYIDMYCEPGDAECEKERTKYLGLAESLVPKLADVSAREFLVARIDEVKRGKMGRAA